MIKQIMVPVENFQDSINEYEEKNQDEKLITTIGPLMGQVQETSLMVPQKKPQLLVLCIFRKEKNNDIEST